jgi:hypothetical protein
VTRSAFGRSTVTVRPRQAQSGRQSVAVKLRSIVDRDMDQHRKGLVGVFSPSVDMCPNYSFSSTSIRIRVRSPSASSGSRDPSARRFALNVLAWSSSGRLRSSGAAKARRWAFGKSKFASQFNVIGFVWSPRQNFLFTKIGKCVYSGPSRFDKRGVRVVTDVEAGGDGRGVCRATSDMTLGLRRRVVLAPLGWCQVRKAMTCARR